MTIGSKLKQLRHYLNFSQGEFAEVLGLAPRAYWNYENDKREIPASNLVKIAQTYKLNLNWLFGDADDMVLNNNNIYKIASNIKSSDCYALPVRGNVEASMGYGITVYDETQTATYSISKKLAYDLSISPTASEVIFARGDSMEPTIFGGDSVLVDQSKTTIHDGVIYCIRLDGEPLIKRLQRLAPNKIGVVSDNPKYKMREVILDENNIDNFNIIGEVRWWGRIAK